MDQELKQRLIGYLDALEKGVTTGGEFVAEQAPEVCREIVNWRIAEGGLAVLMSAVLLVFAAVLYRGSMRWLGPKPVFEEPKNVAGKTGVWLEDAIDSEMRKHLSRLQDWDGYKFFLSLGCLSVVAVALISPAMKIQSAAKAIFAPRLVILEEIRKHL